MRSLGAFQFTQDEKATLLCAFHIYTPPRYKNHRFSVETLDVLNLYTGAVAFKIRLRFFRVSTRDLKQVVFEACDHP